MSKKRLAIFASGGGSNAQKIIDFFETDKSVEISIIICNKSTAKVLERADKYNILSYVVSREDFYHTSLIVDKLKNLDIDLIILAGFLWLIPNELIQEFPKRIINIHPALLPKYGGKGMYGKHIHQAVKENQEKESGITIHYVNQKYDEGQIIFQKSIAITPKDTPTEIAEKVLSLEHKYFPLVIDHLLKEGE